MYKQKKRGFIAYLFTRLWNALTPNKFSPRRGVSVSLITLGVMRNFPDFVNQNKS